MDRDRKPIHERETTKKEIETPTILACDPSLTAWGWVIIDFHGDILDHGCIKTEPSNKKLRIRKGDDRCRRINEITAVLIDLINRYNVQLILSEQPHGSQSAVAAVMIGICLGIAQTLADCMNIAIEWYSEGESKKRLLGKRSGTKGETIAAISRHYPDLEWTGTKYKDEAIADAMAVYHYAKAASSLLRMLPK